MKLSRYPLIERESDDNPALVVDVAPDQACGSGSHGGFIFFAGAAETIAADRPVIALSGRSKGEYCEVSWHLRRRGKGPTVMNDLLSQQSGNLNCDFDRECDDVMDSARAQTDTGAPS